MRDALRTCLQIAGGLTEATRRRATAVAKELLDQTGIDVDDLQRRIGDRIPPEVQTLADELIASGRANRDLLIGLIREEVDKTMSRVGRLADEVTKVGVVLEALERRVRNLEDDESSAGAPAASAAAPVEHVPVDDVPPAAAPVTPAAPASKAPVARKAAPAKKAAPVRKTAAPAKKTAPAAKKPAAKKPVAKKAAPAAQKTAAAKEAAPVKKAAPAKKAPAKKAVRRSPQAPEAGRE
ncbi:histone [Streptomyces sp. NBC_01262]|uniref:histone n=1 Tax=Streptomyces sp. NBC_01262 TaxID=2903803 RepID=UPI002E32E395|nr:histone [Streptomyces sp. NBC_01262]